MGSNLLSKRRKQFPSLTILVYINIFVHTEIEIVFENVLKFITVKTMQYMKLRKIT